VTLLGLAVVAFAASPVRVQAPDGPAQLPACAKAGTYTVDVDGAPDKGVCRGFIEQAEPVSFNIPPGKLFDALKTFLEQSGSRGMVPLDLMAPRLCTGDPDCKAGPPSTAGVSGTLPPSEALARLLDGTGVSYVQDQTGTFRFPPSKGAPVAGGRCLWAKSPANACPAQ
jgi:hypothetical protein